MLRADWAMEASLVRFVTHWRSTAQLELFAVLGQAWITVVTLAMMLLGRWSVSGLCVASIALVALAHANTLLGLIRVAHMLSCTRDVELTATSRCALTVRRATIARSRSLHILATALLGLTFAVGDVGLSVTRVAVLAAVLVPWLSLHLRWSLERPILTSSPTQEPTSELEPRTPPAQDPLLSK